MKRRLARRSAPQLRIPLRNQGVFIAHLAREALFGYKALGSHASRQREAVGPVKGMLEEICQR